MEWVTERYCQHDDNYPCHMWATEYHHHCDCDGCILIFFENCFSGITWRVFLVAQPSFVWRRTFGRVGTQQLLHGVRQRKIRAECVELLDCCRHLRGPLPVLFCPVQDEQSIKLWDVLDAVDDGMWLKACGPLSSSSVEVHEIQVLSEKKRDFDFWTQFCHFYSIFRFWDTVRSKNKIQTQIFFLSLIYSSAGAPSHLAAVSLKKRCNVPRE